MRARWHLPPRAAAAVAVLALLVAACSQGREPAASTSPATTPPATGSASGMPVSPTPVLEGAIGSVRVRVTLDGVTVAGDVAVLEATVQRLDSTDSSGMLGFAFSTVVQSGAVNAPRLVDPTTSLVYEVAEDDDDACVCTRGALDLDPGDSTPVQMVFAAPGPDAREIAVLWPHLGLATGVPVRRGPLPAPHLADADARTTPPDPAQVASALVAPLESYRQTPDESVRSRETGDSLTVELAADVLFAVNSSDVEPAAAKALDLAVASVLARGPGRLSVIGHTDDTADEAYNLDLSRRRAQSVATAIADRLDPGQYPTVVEGRGETEPAAPGTSTDARRLNRRVTLVHLADAAPATDGQTAGPDGPLPPTTGVVGTGTEGGQVLDSNKSFRVRAPQARRVGAVLVVDLQVQNDGAEPAIVGGLLASGALSARGSFDAFSQFSSVGVRLVDASTQTFSLDYVVGEADRPDDLPPRSCLCDRFQNISLPPGAVNTVTVLFPDPSQAASSIALEVEDSFRLTDVPVR